MDRDTATNRQQLHNANAQAALHDSSEEERLVAARSFRQGVPLRTTLRTLAHLSIGALWQEASSDGSRCDVACRLSDALKMATEYMAADNALEQLLEALKKDVGALNDHESENAQLLVMGLMRQLDEFIPIVQYTGTELGKAVHLLTPRSDNLKALITFVGSMVD